MRSMLVPRGDDHRRRVARHTQELDFTPPLPAEGKFPEERFLDYDEKNPQVFENIVTLAFKRLREDDWVGMKDVFEEIRRKYRKHTISPEYPNGRKYNLDNNWTPFYSRKLTVKYPQFIGHIEQRNQRVTL